MLPWEQGIFADISSTPSMPELPTALHEIPIAADAILLEGQDEQVIPLALDHELEARYPKVVQDLQDMEFYENRRHQLDLACARWMDLISNNCGCCSVGVQ